MTVLVLVFLATILLGVLALAVLWQFIKKIKKAKIHVGILALGFIVSILYYVLELLLFTSTFGDNIEYYNTLSFRIVVGFLFFAAFCLARTIIVKKAFFNRRLSEQGLSFSYGFGCGWVSLFTLYLTITTVIMGYYGIFFGVKSVDAECVVFNGGAKFSVFPSLVWYYLSLGIVFVSLAVISVASGALLEKIVQKKVRSLIASIWVILLMLFEICAIQMVLYINAIPHWGIAINAAVMAVFSVLLVRFIPIPKEEEAYTKQFE